MIGLVLGVLDPRHLWWGAPTVPTKTRLESRFCHKEGQPRFNSCVSGVDGDPDLNHVPCNLYGVKYIDLVSLAPFQAYGVDGDLVAGWFTRYNNRSLPTVPTVPHGSGASTPPTFHAIIEDRACSYPPPHPPSSLHDRPPGAAATATAADASAAVCVYHPMGADTLLDIRIPPQCQLSATNVTAVDQEGRPIATSCPGGEGGMLTFAAVGPVDHTL